MARASSHAVQISNRKLNADVTAELAAGGFAPIRGVALDEEQTGWGERRENSSSRSLCASEKALASVVAVVRMRRIKTL